MNLSCGSKSTKACPSICRSIQHMKKIQGMTHFLALRCVDESISILLLSHLATYLREGFASVSKLYTNDSYFWWGYLPSTQLKLLSMDLCIMCPLRHALAHYQQGALSSLRMKSSSWPHTSYKCPI